MGDGLDSLKILKDEFTIGGLQTLQFAKTHIQDDSHFLKFINVA